MHFIATNLPVFIFYALITSEKVPSPIFDISLYSRRIKLILFLNFTIHMLFNVLNINLLYAFKKFYKANRIKL